MSSRIGGLELVMLSLTARPGRTLPFWAWCVVALVVTGLYTVTVPLTSAVYQLDLAVAFIIATVQCGSLVLAVMRARTAAVMHLASIAALVVATRDSAGEPWPLPVTGLLSLGGLIVLLGVRERWTVSVSTWWSSVALLVFLIVTSPQRYADPDQWGTNLTIYASYTATVLAAAIAVGQRGRIRADLAAARRDVELEQAQRLHIEERARIARELHDVVAHSMSLVHMQAMSAPVRLKGASISTVNDEFQDIARSARTALAEMRQLMGVLRSDDVELLPQPRLSDIADLVAAVSRADIPIRATVDTAAEQARPLVQLTAYRIVQEALSNVVRHAPAAAIEVTVRADGVALHVAVRNEPSATRSGPTTSPSPDQGGQGLRGMHERVTALGGRLTTRPTDDGGFLVDATIPAAIDHQPEQP
ncbi:sensor histidine kinase [Actinoplanes sp. N902-109]|uniref:sensor histidine kinase n=1 Tax=Actinoplanes sp. (strain N902-109) TaxID=649831 RepID=UPI0003296882|nr:histidine kinase [Actinoplanes sp. N902-109]AGL21567.1 integral membrane sensor signal transduction histidine kinase [Actinoplanes sp. N902-109]